MRFHLLYTGAVHAGIRGGGGGENNNRSGRPARVPPPRTHTPICLHPDRSLRVAAMEASSSSSSSPPHQNQNQNQPNRRGTLLSRFARSLVSKNKRRYQDSSFDLDLSYITSSIIAMGFPAGDRSSGVLGLIEGFYRNHMRHVLAFLDQKHGGGRYKIYNLCSERTYDAELFDGKVASFPFDDHNCPPLRLIQAFVESAKSWLRQSADHVVAVHCKAGKSRTGLMVCCLLIYLNYASSAEEAVAYYNLRRTHDGKGLTLASQQRYLRYYELLLRSPEDLGRPNRPLLLASIRLHHTAPHLFPAVFVSDHSAERLVFSSKMLSGTSQSRWRQVDAVEAEFVLPVPVKVRGHRPARHTFSSSLLVLTRALSNCHHHPTKVEEDFKVKFKDKAGEYYLWLNTRYIKGNQVLLEARELDRYKYRHKSGLNWNLLVELNFADPEEETRR